MDASFEQWSIEHIPHGKHMQRELSLPPISDEEEHYRITSELWRDFQARKHAQDMATLKDYAAWLNGDADDSLSESASSSFDSEESRLTADTLPAESDSDDDRDTQSLATTVDQSESWIKESSWMVAFVCCNAVWIFFFLIIVIRVAFMIHEDHQS